jgi:hypothetical protein
MILSFLAYEVPSTTKMSSRTLLASSTIFLLSRGAIEGQIPILVCPIPERKLTSFSTSGIAIPVTFPVVDFASLTAKQTWYMFTLLSFVLADSFRQHKQCTTRPS